MKIGIVTFIVATVFFAIAPFIVYQYEVSQGTLTNAEDWYSRGENHGPWRYENPWAGFLIFEPQILLFVTSLLTAFISRLERRRGVLVAAFLTIGLVQIPILILQLYYLGWLID